MKAMVYTEYGPPETLCFKEVETPAPSADEVLIRIHAASVTYGDLAFRSGCASQNSRYSGKMLPGRSRRSVQT
jgi:NADPH:quinone reductase-like Zn-dependent oxidoreductase